MLSDDDKREYFMQGGALLVKNVETHYKEMEGMVAQQLAQLDQQIPKNHPMRAQAEAQIKAQEMSKGQMKREIEKRRMAAPLREQFCSFFHPTSFLTKKKSFFLLSPPTFLGESESIVPRHPTRRPDRGGSCDARGAVHGHPQQTV